MLPALLLLVSSAAAFELDTGKRADSDALHAAYRAAGITVESMTCSRQTCLVRFPESERAKNPRRVIDAYQYKDPALARKELRSELVALESKLDAGTADIADLRRTLKIMLLLMGQSQNSNSQ